MPVTATAKRAGERASTPSAIARATSALTAPWRAMSAGGDAEQLALGRVRVGDDAALEPRRSSRRATCTQRRSRPPVHDSAVARVAPRAVSAAASSRDQPVDRVGVAHTNRQAAMTTQRAQRGDDVVEEDAEALRPADRRAAAPLEALVGPRHRAGLGGVEEAEQRRRRPPARRRSRASPARAPARRRSTSSQTIADGSAWSRWRAVTVQAHQPSSVAATMTAPRVAVAEQRRGDGVDEPGPERPRRPGRRRATGRCRSRARSGAPDGRPGSASRAGGRRRRAVDGARARRLMERAPARQARKWSNEPNWLATSVAAAVDEAQARAGLDAADARHRRRRRRRPRRRRRRAATAAR